VCLLASPSGAGAAGPSPTSGPLWNAYPLDTGKPTSTLPETFRGTLQSEDSRISDANVRRPDTPVLASAVLIGALAGLAWIAGAGVVRLVRRRRDSGTARG
jgi:hypothetical protein